MNEDSYTREVIIQMLEAAKDKFSQSPNDPSQVIDDLITHLYIPQSKWIVEDQCFNFTTK